MKSLGEKRFRLSAEPVDIEHQESFAVFVLDREAGGNLPRIMHIGGEECLVRQQTAESSCEVKR